MKKQDLSSQQHAHMENHKKKHRKSEDWKTRRYKEKPSELKKLGTEELREERRKDEHVIRKLEEKEAKERKEELKDHKMIEDMREAIEKGGDPGDHVILEARREQREAASARLQSLLSVDERIDALTAAGSGAVVGPGKVIFVTSNPVSKKSGKREGRLEALNFTTGQLLWQVNLDAPISNGPVVGQLHPGGEGNLSVLVTVEAELRHGNSSRKTLRSGKILTFTAFTGAARNWSFQQEPWLESGRCGRVRDQALSSPAIGGDGTVYVGSGNGQLYAIRDHDGDGFINSTKEVTSFSTGSSFGTSPGIAPGLLVAAPCDSLLVFKSF